MSLRDLNHAPARGDGLSQPAYPVGSACLTDTLLDGRKRGAVEGDGRSEMPHPRPLPNDRVLTSAISDGSWKPIHRRKLLWLA